MTTGQISSRFTHYLWPFLALQGYEAAFGYKMRAIASSAEKEEKRDIILQHVFLGALNGLASLAPAIAMLFSMPSCAPIGCCLGLYRMAYVISDLVFLNGNFSSSPFSLIRERQCLYMLGVRAMFEICFMSYLFVPVDLCVEAKNIFWEIKQILDANALSVLSKPPVSTQASGNSDSPRAVSSPESSRVTSPSPEKKSNGISKFEHKID